MPMRSTLIATAAPTLAAGPVWVQPRLARLGSDINGVLELPEMMERLSKLGGETVGGSREESGRRVVAEVAKSATVIKEIGRPPMSA